MLPVGDAREATDHTPGHAQGPQARGRNAVSGALGTRVRPVPPAEHVGDAEADRNRQRERMDPPASAESGIDLARPRLRPEQQGPAHAGHHEAPPGLPDGSSGQ
jgi:hypothetical protein